MGLLGSLVLLGQRRVLFVLGCDELLLRARLLNDGGEIHLAA